MKGKFIALVLAAAVAWLAACSGDDAEPVAVQNPGDASNTTGENQTSTGEGVLNIDSLIAASRENPVPCEEEGAFNWIEVGKSFYRCESLVWNAYRVEPHKRGFDPCRFNFGAAWDTQKERDSTNYAGLDYIAVWLGDNDFYNGFEERMVKMCVNIHATPMIYAYVIAEFGKDHGLSDCDVKGSEKTHCTHGAQLIRDFFADSILYRYKAYAEGMREQLIYRLDVDADTFSTIWLIEPDFYQYSETASKQKELYDGAVQEGGGIPDGEMGVYFKQIVETIRTYLPAAKIVIDISPWIADKDADGFVKWYSNFDMNLVQFAGTSGGTSLAINTKIVASNKATWAGIHEVTGRPILADAGYGAGGGSTGHKAPWDNVLNLKARMAEGVIGIMQMNAANDYPMRADTIRPQLKADFPWCVDGVYVQPESPVPVVNPTVEPEVDSSLVPADSGTVAVDPDAASMDSGSVTPVPTEPAEDSPVAPADSAVASEESVGDSPAPDAGVNAADVASPPAETTPVTEASGTDAAGESAE